MFTLLLVSEIEFHYCVSIPPFATPPSPALVPHSPPNPVYSPISRSRSPLPSQSRLLPHIPLSFPTPLPIPSTPPSPALVPHSPPNPARSLFSSQLRSPCSVLFRYSQRYRQRNNDIYISYSDSLFPKYFVDLFVDISRDVLVHHITKCGRA